VLLPGWFLFFHEGVAAGMKQEWVGFLGQKWQQEIDVRDFIQHNYTPYTGGGDFLCNETEKTKKLWQKCLALFKEERSNGGVLSIDVSRVSGINAFGPGYVDRELELIVGLQTERPLERSVNPFGGLRMARGACNAYGYTFDRRLEEFFAKYRKTHNDGVFDAYTSEMRLARSLGIITGLPDAYGRGRIINDSALHISKLKDLITALGDQVQKIELLP